MHGGCHKAKGSRHDLGNLEGEFLLDGKSCGFTFSVVTMQIIISCEGIKESEEMLSLDIGSNHMANMEPEMNLTITVNTFQSLF